MEHTALSRRQSVAVVAVADAVLLVELVVAGVHAGADESACVVVRAGAYGEVSAGLSQYVTGFGFMYCICLHAWP